MDHEEYVEKVRLEIGQTATKMISGDLSFLEGARKISRIRFEAELDNDPDIMIFVGIDDQTDALPIDEVRQHWLPEALGKKQPEIDQAEKWAREEASIYCKKIIERFGK